MRSLKIKSLLWPDAAVWLFLVVLLFANLALAYVHIVPGNAINYAIAFVMACLVALFLMHLKRSASLIRLVAAIAVLWMLIFFSLTFGDFLTR